jgi:hypothetical protein
MRLLAIANLVFGRRCSYCHRRELVTFKDEPLCGYHLEIKYQKERSKIPFDPTPLYQPESEGAP